MKNDFGIRFYGLNSSCAFIDVRGFSYYMDGLREGTKSKKRRYLLDLVYAMSNYTPDKHEKGSAFSGWEIRHYICVWNRCHIEPATGEFVDIMRECGWIVTDGGMGPHGGYETYAILHPEAHDKFMKEYPELIAEK